MLFERYSFVALTTTNLARARSFWSEQLGFPISEEAPGQFVIVDAGGLRLCLDLDDGDIHLAGGTDPVIGLKVKSLSETLAALKDRGVCPERGPVNNRSGSYAVIRDPDGHALIVTETD